jgi:hypothetical protein
LLALVWGVLIFEALFVVGRLISRYFLGGVSHHMLYPVSGLLLVLFLGGYLNIFGLLSATLINIFVISGALLFSYYVMAYIPAIIQNFRQQIYHHSPAVFILPLVAFFSLLWAYLTSVGNINFNMHDDFHAYLFFPNKLLHRGSLDVDPFSERRLISGLAGNSLLLMIGLVQMKWYFLHAIDWGLGILVFAYSISMTKISVSFGKAFLIKSSLVIGIALFSIPAANITSNVLPMAIVFTIWAWLYKISNFQKAGSPLGLRDGFFLGVLLASLLTLKSTLTPYVAICTLLVICYCTYILHINKVKFFLGAVIGSALMLFPWMIDLYKSSGSFFYPLLGKGFHATQYGYFHGATENFLSKETMLADLAVIISPLGKSVFSISILLLLVLLFYMYRDRAQCRLLILPAMPLIASILNCLVVGYAIGGYGAYRYVYFMGLASLVISVMIASLHINKRPIVIVISCICAFFVVRGIQDQVLHFSNYESDIKNSWNNKNPLSERDRTRYLAASDALPSDGRILLRVAYPFLMYTTQNLLVADYPGAASPPPGMPIGRGPEELSAYLQSQGIKYIVWDYETQANFGREEYGDRLNPRTHPWIRSEAELSFDFQDNLELLRLRGKTIYDRDGISIIDLR